MSELIDMALAEGKQSMDGALDHLNVELAKVRTGRANISLVKDLIIDYFGVPTPLSNAANLSTPDSKTISIQPWDKSLLGAIERSIFEANIGITPMNDGEFVRISIPPMTEERRKEMVKKAKSLGEESKVSLRNDRQKMMSIIKSEVKEGFPEDMGKKMEGQVEGMIKSYVEKIGKMLDAKEADIMKV